MLAPREYLDAARAPLLCAQASRAGGDASLRVFLDAGRTRATGYRLYLFYPHENSPLKILVTGSIAYDTIMVFPDRFKNHLLADQLHILNVCFLTPEMRREFGGTAGNIGYNLKLLGEDPLVMATVGEDIAPYLERLAAPRHRRAAAEAACPASSPRRRSSPPTSTTTRSPPSIRAR